MTNWIFQPVQLSILSTWKIQLVMVHQCQHPPPQLKHRKAPIRAVLGACTFAVRTHALRKKARDRGERGLGLGRDPVVLGFVDFNDFKGSLFLFYYLLIFHDISTSILIKSIQMESD